MEKRKEELKKKLNSIHNESMKLTLRLEQLEEMENALQDELDGIIGVEKELEKQKQRILEKKKQEEIENTCGKDLADSMPQGHE